MPQLSDNTVHKIAAAIRYRPEITNAITGVNGAPTPEDIRLAVKAEFADRNIRGERSIRRIAEALVLY
jgi:hypothetical protein